ncbi:MAG TPA: hypothetical protein VL093_07550 [Flavipsychrobacter sp.]|nr:hypothetical protein [Flavipsychrobacter sp.]
MFGSDNYEFEASAIEFKTNEYELDTILIECEKNSYEFAINSQEFETIFKESGKIVYPSGLRALFMTAFPQKLRILLAIPALFFCSILDKEKNLAIFAPLIIKT